ncbi:cob(I)yrinic acid a,c-diamide adenosyltransferase [Clostridium lacusfryxellense]|uniref:cob(I)yrinic acid a,c-diamide adenosyltransferase n=1 Tax=Clostridium lacusfryxellense TaxID=205328 RepID=UPI001C0CE511|nr:cob(I)yrinic acid a,c-diamide adenosyltransferase [Clostridium lacusfryxellense]MBU3112762.1 cob(I)yrinic acid a,c-diamide adenosyltransferase [Clostridium lacusfryxellense]
MSITTKNGDKGYTNLLNNASVLKSDPRVNILGEIDGLSSYLGLLKSEIEEDTIKGELSYIQSNISTVMAEIAAGNNDKYHLSKENLNEIEKLINHYEGMYISQNKFILPGENRISSIMDICRTVTRKVERLLIDIDLTYPVDEYSKKYINRLSDYLFATARYVDFREEITKKVKESLKIKGANYEAKKVLDLDLSKILLGKIEKKATSNGLPVVIAIANQWGNIIAVHFMDGALPGSYDVAVNKAYTSAIYRLGTLELGKMSKSGQTLQGINSADSRIVIFGGGYPLKINNKFVGSVGVSGGNGQQDDEIALYGVNVMEELSEGGGQ